MSCSNNEDILFSEKFDFNNEKDVSNLGTNYVEIINKSGNNYIKDCFVRTQLLDYFSTEFIDQNTLWGNGKLEERYKPVYKNIYAGYFITQESMYFLSLPTYKTFLSVDCESVKIGSYFGVSTTHGTEEKVCRLIPLIEIKDKSKYSSERIVELNFDNELKTYVYAFIKTDDFIFNDMSGSFIGDLDNFGYFYINDTKSVFDTSLPSTQVFFNGTDNWIKYVFEETKIEIEFKFKLGDKIHNIKSDVQDDGDYLNFTHRFEDKVYNWSDENIVEKYGSQFNAYSKMQKLKLDMLCFLVYLDLLDEKYDYIFYGVNMKEFIDTFVITVGMFINWDENLKKKALEDFITNEKLAHILRRITNNFDIYRLRVIVELGNIVPMLYKYEDIISSSKINAIGEYVDKHNKNLLMLVLAEYFETRQNKEEVLEFVRKFVDEYDGNINSLDLYDNSALKQAFKIYIADGESEFIDLLISKRANLNIHNLSLLHYAVFNQSERGVRYLLEKGMDVNTISPVYFQTYSCDKKISPLEFNFFLPEFKNIDPDKNMEIERILFSRGSKPAREIDDIPCENVEDEFEEEEEEESNRNLSSDFEEVKQEESPRNLLSDFEEVESDLEEEEEEEEELSFDTFDLQFVEEKLNDVKNSDDVEQVLEIIDKLKEEDLLEKRNSMGYAIGHIIVMNDNLDEEDKKRAIEYLSNETDYALDIVDWKDNTMLQYAVYEHQEYLVDFLLNLGVDKDHVSKKDIFKDLSMREIAMLKPNYEETVEILENF